MLAKFGLVSSMALVAVANAILLPPQMADDFPGIESLGTPAQLDPYRRDVLLECPTCPRATAEGSFYKLAWAGDTGNSFLLSFEVGPDRKTLLLDGVQIYPRSFESAMGPPQFFDVTQYGANDPLPLGVTGYTTFYPSAPVHKDSGLDLIPVTLIIEQIGYQPMRVPPLTIYLLQDADGHVMIASFKSDGSAQAQEDCKDWLSCKLEALKDKFHSMASAMKHGCHKLKGGAVGQVANDGDERHHHGGHHHPEGDHRDGNRPHHHHGHKHHDHKQHKHKANAFMRIGAPMLLGAMIVWLLWAVAWSVYYVVVGVNEMYRGRSFVWVPEEGETNYAVLPQCEAPPVYEEVAEKEVVVEEKN
ncbi:uncharacterized protein EI97DRAFT_445820 [Westerdykella ornata]|uniref:DUF7728 domain-containing protein n=1 Tax=Westerdykella ornata TaxID=318751 RepID=A0A6A6J7I3_WESOR|nr:uncharacterized protein EI97DRAFT_445820 [Westerdykella ornata]KAF2272362.1 hypothetical protein EI97DRAFT_445820 [Westerdykella ornata]